MNRLFTGTSGVTTLLQRQRCRMNRYNPVIFMAVGLVITAGIGGAVTFWDVESPFTSSDGPSHAVEEYSDERQQPALPVTSESSLVVDRTGSSIHVEATVENPKDVAIDTVIALRIDGDQDGEFELTADKQSTTLSAGAVETLVLTVPISRLGPGTYEYVVGSADGSVHWDTGSFELQPANFAVNDVETEPVVRGEPATITATVSNGGDFSRAQTVTLTGPSDTHGRTVELGPGERTTINFTVATGSLTGGNYTYAVRTETAVERVSLHVRAAEFEVSDLEGAETYTAGDEVTVSARLRNVGNAKAVRQVELRIDLDDDDDPESVGIEKEVGLAPGENTTVSFTVTDERWGDAVSTGSLVGTHIVGIFTNASNVTGTLVVEPFSTDGTDGAGDTGEDIASRDEISQEKYGLFYSELSAETQAQVDEIYTRQPFAGDLVVTEVLTREEIARQQFGHEIEPGEPFDFTALDIQVQQQVEAAFDAQFTSQRGDRIESWDELARSKYGKPYDELTAEEQEVIRNEYQQQFDNDG